MIQWIIPVNTTSKTFATVNCQIQLYFIACTPIGIRPLRKVTCLFITIDLLNTGNPIEKLAQLSYRHRAITVVADRASRLYHRCQARFRFTKLLHIGSRQWYSHRPADWLDRRLRRNATKKTVCPSKLVIMPAQSATAVEQQIMEVPGHESFVIIFLKPTVARRWPHKVAHHQKSKHTDNVIGILRREMLSKLYWSNRHPKLINDTCRNRTIQPHTRMRERRFQIMVTVLISPDISET